MNLSLQLKLHVVSITGIGISTLLNNLIYEPVDHVNTDGLTINIYYSDVYFAKRRPRVYTQL
ncbi:hypothetical protein MASR1M31_21690 [Porphyromonadaceae bacterium]